MSSLVQNTAIAAVAAAVINAIFYLVGGAVGVTYLTSGQTVGLIGVIFASLITAAVAGGVYWWISGRYDDPADRFLWVAAIVGALSLAGPIFMAQDASSTVWLGLMHIISAGVVTLILSVNSHPQQA